jgi:aspartate kinase
MVGDRSRAVDAMLAHRSGAVEIQKLGPPAYFVITAAVAVKLLANPPGKTAPDAVARPILVQKYGGSSVADPEKLGRVADRVVAARRAGFDVVVVVSAMGKTTDQLLALAREVAAEGEPPRREMDMLLSTGERVAMSLLSIAIQARGEAAISFTGSQSGIITNDRHCDARIIEVRPHRIEDELARGRIVIVAGYQGMSYRREITTLGRGGSDTTAVALAAALGAERCEIYSDVDGVYSADPRVVAEAQHLPEMSYETLQEMAESGAKVLCAQAVEWARRAGVVLFARSTFAVEARETRVQRFAPADEPRARAVTADSQVALVTLRDESLLAAALEAIDAAGLALRELLQGESRADLVVSLRNGSLRDLERRLEPLGEAAQAPRSLAQVSVVGAGLGESVAAIAAFRAVLAELEIEPLLVAVSPLRLSAVVPPPACDRLVRALHAAFV